LSYPSGTIEPTEDVGKVEIQVKVPENIISSQAGPANRGIKTPPNGKPRLMAGTSVELRQMSPGALLLGAEGIRVSQFEEEESDTVIYEDGLSPGSNNTTGIQEESK